MARLSRICKWHDSDNEDNPNGPLRCHDCNHYKTWHDDVDNEPESGLVKGILKRCEVDIGAMQKVRATKAEAAIEALAGLKNDMDRGRTSLVCN
jgi:hypothetical protein